MNQPRVSIIIPVWNHLEELRACLASVEQQTFTSFEVIVVDDGSTDHVFSFLQNRQWKVPHSILQNTSNQGAPVARNKGFQAAKGEFIIFLDADTILVPHAIEAMVHILETQPDIDFVYSSFRFGWKIFKGKPFDAAALHTMNYIHTSALMRRERFSGFDETLKKFQDWDLWLTMTKNGCRGYWIDEVLYSISTRRNGYSHWLPKFMYRLPLARYFSTRVRRYNEAKLIISKKHKL